MLTHPDANQSRVGLCEPEHAQQPSVHMNTLESSLKPSHVYIKFLSKHEVEVFFPLQNLVKEMYGNVIFMWE